MPDRDLGELVARLNSGGRRRRKAALALAGVRSPAAVGALARAYASSGDARLDEIAAGALAGLDDQVAIDAVCEALIETGDDRLAELVAAAGYRHSDPARRAVQLFVAGDFDAYAELDFDGSALAAAQAVADGPLRSRLADRARASGRIEWVRAATGGSRPGALSDPEWETAIGILTATGRLDELWRLVPQAPPLWGVRMLRELAERDWRPANESERAGFDELAGLSLACAGDGSPAGLLPEAPSAELRGHRKAVSGLAALPGMLVSGGFDGAVLLRRLPDGAPAGVLRAHESVHELAVSPDGKLLATHGYDPGIEQPVRLWDLSSQKMIGSILPHYGLVGSLAVTPDSRLLVTGGHGEVGLWHLPDLTPAGALPVSQKKSVDGLAMTADGSMLVAGCALGETQLWRLRDRTAIGSLPRRKSEQGCVAVTPDGGLLASASFGQVWLWRLPDLTPAGDLRRSTDCLAVTPDGRLLVTGGDHGVELWRLPDLTPAGTLTWHESRVRRLAIAPDGALLAGSDEYGTVRLWDLGLRKAVHTPLGEFEPAEAGRLANGDLTGYSGSRRTWAATLAALLRWRRRYDIEVGDSATPVAGAGAADIEIGSG